MKNQFYLLLAALIAVGAFISCDENGTDPDPLDSLVFPDSNATYNDHVQTLLKYNCTQANCHGVLTGPNATPMYSYYELMHNPNNEFIGLIIKYQPDQSLLVKIFENKIGHAGAPYYNWNINDNQKAGLRKWIEQGAVEKAEDYE